MFICGLVGAVSTLYLLSGTGEFAAWPVQRRLAPLVPVAGVVLCLVRNNHGIGLVTGRVFGVLFALAARHRMTSAAPSA